MNRRKFLKTSTISLPSLGLLLSLASCGKEGVEPILSDKKIVIIGAGIAGLAAANYFKSRNLDVVILEAQNKVGGRLKTDRSLGFPFDMGASWIHGPDGNPITAIANFANANTFLTDDENISIFDIDGSEYAESIIDQAEIEYNDILDSFSGSFDESFSEAFFSQFPQYQNNRLWNYMLSAFLEFDTGGDIENLTATDFFDDSSFDGKDLIITNGFDTIAEYLAMGLDIRFNTQVSAIDTSNVLIDMETNNENFTADFVLITVPLGVLKQNQITFSPPLTIDIQESINNLEMGTINKFLCVWDSPFWNTDLQYLGFTSEVKGKFNYFLNLKKVTDTNGLMVFATGEYSRLTESMSDTEVINDIMNNLKPIYGDNIPEPTQMLRTRWSADEYTFGSYSYVSQGNQSSDYEKFEAPIDGKLFFAGEHTSKDYRGTVHGAYLSGIREAEKIAEFL